jgi:peptide/nickel transport system ATP-binding protein
VGADPSHLASGALRERGAQVRDAGMADPLLGITDLEWSYATSSRLNLRFRRRAPKPAVQRINLELAAGETLAVVGESGSGKTTIARAVAGLIAPARGTITFRGQDITGPVERRPRDTQRAIQYIFQNPDASLNPRRRIGAIVGRPVRHFFGLGGQPVETRVAELLEAVHLDPRHASRFPGQLSGGERQRVALAQALAAEPDLVLCDEILSALDVSVQAGILDLLRELQRERGLTYLFIAHDLAVVRGLADRVAVLCGGELMEVGRCDEVFAPPYHPYTRLLLDSTPKPRVPERAEDRAEGGPREPAARNHP